MSQEFNVGSAPYSTASFKDADGTAVDPAAVYVQVMDPDENIDEYQYGVDGEVTRTATGEYKFESIDVDDEGTWYVRWRGEGIYQCAAEVRFVARYSPFI